MYIALKVEPALHFLWIGPLPGRFAPPLETDLQCFGSFLPPKEEAGTHKESQMVFGLVLVFIRGVTNT